MIPKWLLPEKFQLSAFIAGGFAACPSLADDIDVWVMVSKSKVPSVVAELTAHLNTRELEGGYGRFEAQPSADAKIRAHATGDYPVESMRVGKFTAYGYSHPFHVIVTSGTAQEVLDKFDISTHMVAITSTGVVTGDGWTPVTEPPIAFRNTALTPQRLQKIAKRFGHPDPIDITNPAPVVALDV
jgi:hypothetical protein